MEAARVLLGYAAACNKSADPAQVLPDPAVLPFASECTRDGIDSGLPSSMKECLGAAPCGVWLGSPSTCLYAEAFSSKRLDGNAIFGSAATSFAD